MNNVAVIGAGAMGNGIAHIFAMHRYQVALVDIAPEALDHALATISRNLDRMIKKEVIPPERKDETLGQITTFTELSMAVSQVDLVVEAATERFEIKEKLFRAMDQHAPAEAILATNTSAISITRIAAATSRPEQVIGMHFMNPVPVMQLVEVIRGYATTDEVTTKVMEIARRLGKTPVEVNDYPGFISNRVLLPMINEAIHALYEGVAGVEEIDTVMKLGMAHPMGPLRLADLIGLDVCRFILNVIHEGFGNPKYAPCPLLVKMATAGKLGRKTGEGFYDYREDPKNPKVAKGFRR